MIHASLYLSQGPSWKPLGGRLKPSGSLLGASWGPLRGLLGPFEPPWEQFWTVLEAFWWPLVLFYKLTSHFPSTMCCSAVSPLGPVLEASRCVTLPATLLFVSCSSFLLLVFFPKPFPRNTGTCYASTRARRNARSD